MDLLSLSKRLRGMENRWGGSVTPTPASAEGHADRLKEIVKQVSSKRATKNKWGGKNYPIDVADYGQFLSTLQMLSWTFRDLGYDVHFLTRGGLSYDHREYIVHNTCFSSGSNHIVALVACNGNACFRISRDAKTLRYRIFDNQTRALAPLRDGDTSGTRPVSVLLVKELVRQMEHQSLLDPANEDSLKRWGRLINCMRPASATTLKSRLKIEFRKVR